MFEKIGVVLGNIKIEFFFVWIGWEMMLLYFEVFSLDVFWILFWYLYNGI